MVQGVNLPLPQGRPEVILGREDPIGGIHPDIDLTPYGGDVAGVSRRHACIRLQGTRFLIEDWNSRNHTYVNGQRLEPWQSYPLQDGDEIYLGQLRLTFHVPAS